MVRADAKSEESSKSLIMMTVESVIANGRMHRLLMAYSNGDEVAEGIWVRLEDFRSEHWAFEQQRRINKQSLWYCQQCFPVPRTATRSAFSGDNSSTINWVVICSWGVFPSRKFDFARPWSRKSIRRTIITRVYMSAEPFLKTLVREATLASMVSRDSNLATLPLLD